jgi:hypothetical protein
MDSRVCPYFAIAVEKVRREKALDFSGCNSRPGRGKVVRAQPTISGNFAVAIAFDHLRL